MIFKEVKLNIAYREIWILVLVSLSLITSCTLISFHKPFWNDELYSWYLLSDASFVHMLNAFGDKINNTPILYFFGGWIWAKLFGSSELSLRLFSSIGFCVGLIIVWLTLRRTYRFWAATIGSLAVFCTSELVLTQNAEARMYGLFIAVCSLALLLYDTINRQEKIPKSLLLINTIAHVAIVHTHLFGLFYSGAFFLSFAIRDLWIYGKRIFYARYALYLSFILAWLSFVFYLPAFLVQLDVGRPYSWIPKPILQDLISLLTLSSASFMKLSVLLLVILVTGLQFLVFKNSSSQVEQFNQADQERPLLLLAYIFLMVPIFIWVLSRLGRPIFYDRYLIPSMLSWTILVAHSIEKLMGLPKPNVRNLNPNIFDFWSNYAQSLLPLGLTIVLLFQPIAYGMAYGGRYIPGYLDNTYGYADLPMVIQSSSGFLERRFYSPHKDRYFFILDWKAANTEASGRFGIQEYKHLDAINRNYSHLFNNHIVTSKDFLEKNQEFLVLDSANYKEQCSINVQGGLEKARVWQGIHCPQWVEKRLLSNPKYNVTELGKMYGEVILLVKMQK